MIKLKNVALAFFVLNTLVLSTLAQTYKLVGTTSTRGGTVFAMNEDGTEVGKWVDFMSGEYPFSKLIFSNNKIWGTSSRGGAYNAGTIYCLDEDGTNYKKIFDFNGSELGSTPYGSLIEYNGKLWGMTYNGGSQGNGIIYSFDFDGTNFNVVHSFNSTSEGKNPHGGLVEHDGILYGMTLYGGNSNMGVIFSYDIAGNIYQKIHDFNDTNGANPRGSLIVVDNKLYGMTEKGGENSLGVIFSVRFDGANFAKLFDFSLTSGNQPKGSLLFSGDRLWGLTSNGGMVNDGVIFNLNTDGTDFLITKSFQTNDGSNPYSELVEIDGKFWGTTISGGEFGAGTVFRMDVDGSNFEKIHDFNVSEGEYAYGSLVVQGEKVFGVSNGGGNYDLGLIYSMDLSGQNYQVSHEFGYQQGRLPTGSLLKVGDRLWGMTSEGGTHDYGVIYSVSIGGGDINVFHHFEGFDGRHPYGSLIESSGKIWGMTSQGGEGGDGVIFSLDTDGTNYNVSYNFNGGNGRAVYGSLIESNGKLWGMAAEGGLNGKGTIFNLDLDGNNFSKVHDFTVGNMPFGNLIVSNGKLWGMTSEGGASAKGIIFSLDPVNSNFEIVHEFSGDPLDGATPYGSLLFAYGKLWGLTYAGGANGYGCVFSLELDGTGFDIVHSFNDESYPYGNIIASNDKLWVVSSAGGLGDDGVIFSLNSDGTNYTKIHDLTMSTTGEDPEYTSLLSLIIKGDQAITFAYLEEKTFGDDSFELTANSSASLGIYYTSSDENIATIDGTTVTVVGVGSTIITASQLGNEEFNAATSVSQTLVVNKAAQIITFDELPVLGIGETYELAANATSELAITYASSNESVASVDNGILEIHAFGDVTITASQAGNGYYLPATSVEHDLTINTITSTEIGVKTTPLIYPNPANDQIHLHADFDISQVEIIGVLGEKIAYPVWEQNGRECTVKIDVLPEGLYLLRIQDESQSSIHRFVKK